MRAYICTTDYDGTGGVLFADTNLKARKWAANEWNDGELGGLHVVRAPGLDQYAASAVPASVLICDYGWSWEGCHHCGQRLEADDLRDAGKDPRAIVGTQNSFVFCDTKCQAAHKSEQAEIEIAGQTVITAISDRIHRRFGYVPIGETHHYTIMSGGLCTTLQARVAFHFPGQKIGPANMHYDDPLCAGSNSNLPHPLWLTCCGGDRDVFEAWAREARP